MVGRSLLGIWYVVDRGLRVTKLGPTNQYASRTKIAIHRQGVGPLIGLVV